MISSAALFAFELPRVATATRPPEARGVARDEVRLLLTTPDGEHRDHAFTDLPRLLAPGDLLVANRSATLPASLPATGAFGSFILNLSTRYGADLWLAEPRWNHARPGPLPLTRGDEITVAGVSARVGAPHPRLARLLFVTFARPIDEAMARLGTPIRYGYVEEPHDLEAYQTIFAAEPGSAEMPSAGRPFTPRVLAALADRGVGVTTVTLHTGVSSLEADDMGGDALAGLTLFAEPFEVTETAAEAIASTRQRGGRVVAVGTTVVRALESAWRAGRVHATAGFTRRVVQPGAFHGSVDAILTGLHASGSSHLAMLGAIAGSRTLRSAYRAALDGGYLWHEFGDVHLLGGARRRDAAERFGGGARPVRPESDRAP